jgi:FAD/FMN-containing dehydrogenase
MYDRDALLAALAPFTHETNPALVKQKSRDFYWYSPILKAELDAVAGDVVASPANEAEVIAILKIAHDLGCPVTPRGAGTGNYGQAMPLSGGLVLDLSRMNRITAIAPGRVTAEAGALIHDISAATRAASGQELRLWPSTAKTATIGGFIAGGSGGVGSVAWGGLRDPGNIVSVRVVTMEATPRVLDLAGDDLAKVSHAYGTTGIITEVTMPLTAAVDWVDAVFAFPDLAGAVGFGDELARMDGVEKKEIGVVAAPAPHRYFLRHRRYLGEAEHVVLAMLAPTSMRAAADAAARGGGRVAFRSDTASAGELKGLPPVYELAWNHTTLRALRVDPNVTYLQILFPAPDTVGLVLKTAKIFGDEAPVHLEFARFDGDVIAFGLHLVHFSTPERLAEIMARFEAEGCPVFNPHRYTLEEGGMKQTDRLQLAFKRDADPKGLLNPGKMVAFEDPHFDFSAGRNWLFPGLAGAAAPAGRPAAE